MSKTARPARTRTTRTTSTAKAPAKRTRSPRTTAAKAPAVKAAAKPAKRPSTRLPADVKLAIAAAQDKLAVDLTVLDLRNSTAFTDFFIVCTGTNTKQVQAIADGIQASLRAHGQQPALVEGYHRGEWVLLDYFTFIAHIFLPSRRSFYALERLWGGAEPIEVSAP
jgi:ribosome-associated protein